MNAHAFAARTVVIALAAAVLAAVSSPADAIERLRSDLNRCADVQATVQRQGAVILRYPSTRVPDYFLYDRYVSGLSQCRLGEELERETVPAADTASCRVYTCKRAEPKFNDELLFRF